MDRQGLFFDFPPDVDDLVKPADLLASAGERLAKAEATLHTLTQQCDKFPAVNAEAAKRQLLSRLQSTMKRINALRTDITKLTDDTMDLRESIVDAYHNPNKGRDLVYIAAEDPRWRAGSV